jgi:hypothetical protein
MFSFFSLHLQTPFSVLTLPLTPPLHPSTAPNNLAKINFWRAQYECSNEAAHCIGSYAARADV